MSTREGHVSETGKVQFTHRQRFLAVLEGRRADRTPLFPLLMFLAVDRAGMTYREYATHGKALAEAQLFAQERYDLDAITACSDAFRVSADLGGDMVFPDDKPPYLRSPLLRSDGDLARLGVLDPTTPGSRMADRIAATAEMVRSVHGEVAVLGWIDMPFAEACSLCGVAEFMVLMKDNPGRAHRILTYLTEVVVAFARAQIEAGADMIGAGDAAASLVSASMYEEFALSYERQVCSAIHDAGSRVKLHICGDTTHLMSKSVDSGADLFNVDHMVAFEQARDVYSAHGKCFKGNLDPVEEIMRSSPEQCRQLAHTCIAQAAGTRYMLSAGCEIPAETPDEVMKAFCEAPKTFFH